MSNTIEYKNYLGSVEFSERDKLFYGKVLGIRSLISYEGKTADELIESFHSSIDEYLKACAQDQVEPEVAYKGSFNVRIGADLHKQAAIYATEHKQSLNSFVEEAVRSKLLTTQ